MNSIARTTARTFLVRSKVGVATTTSSLRSFSSHLAEDLYAKEKIEEDRYMRKKDEEYLKKEHDNLVKQAEAVAKAKEEKEFQERVLPVMNELETLLKKSNDTLSKASLETIAKWKLNMQ